MMPMVYQSPAQSALFPNLGHYCMKTGYEWHIEIYVNWIFMGYIYGIWVINMGYERHIVMGYVHWTMEYWRDINGKVIGYIYWRMEYEWDSDWTLLNFMGNFMSELTSLGFNESKNGKIQEKRGVVVGKRIFHWGF